MRDLRVTLVQTATAWHDPGANRAHFDGLLAELAGTADLVVLPEMFSTGFTMASREQAETMSGPTVAWLQAQAARLDACVCGSVVIRNGKDHFNRFVAALPGGGLVAYDKRHLFRMAGEHEHYSPGDERVLFEYRDWRICPQVCYDLRFPAFSRNALARDGGYDLLLFVANWPARRAAQWRALLAARAIENQSWVVGVNVIGTDGAGVSYQGDSVVHDFMGERVLALDGRAEIATHTLARAPLAEWREAFPAWKDADTIDLAAPSEANNGE